MHVFNVLPELSLPTEEFVNSVLLEPTAMQMVPNRVSLVHVDSTLRLIAPPVPSVFQEHFPAVERPVSFVL